MYAFFLYLVFALLGTFLVGLAAQLFLRSHKLLTALAIGAMPILVVFRFPSPPPLEVWLWPLGVGIIASFGGWGVAALMSTIWARFKS